MKQVMKQKWKLNMGLAVVLTLVTVQGNSASAQARVAAKVSQPLQVTCQIDYDGAVALQKSVGRTEGKGRELLGDPLVDSPDFKNITSVGIKMASDTTQLAAKLQLINHCIGLSRADQNYSISGIAWSNEVYEGRYTLRVSGSNTKYIANFVACAINNRKVCRDFINANAVCEYQRVSEN